MGGKSSATDQSKENQKEKVEESPKRVSTSDPLSFLLGKK